MFSGLISRWTMFWWCRYWITSSTFCISDRASTSLYRPSLMIRSKRSPPVTSSMIMYKCFCAVKRQHCAHLSLDDFLHERNPGVTQTPQQLRFPQNRLHLIFLRGSGEAGARYAVHHLAEVDDLRGVHVSGRDFAAKLDFAEVSFAQLAFHAIPIFEAIQSMRELSVAQECILLGD